MVMKLNLVAPPRSKDNCLIGGKIYMYENVVYIRGNNLPPKKISTRKKDIQVYPLVIGSSVYITIDALLNIYLKNQTSLSKHYWDLVDKGLTPHFEWRFLSRARTPNNFCNRCDLCIAENFFIKDKNQDELLYLRSEIISKCRHKKQFKT